MVQIIRVDEARREHRGTTTVFRHVFISHLTANDTRPVSRYFLKRYLTNHGISLDRVRRDRVLGEALATGADPLHLQALFDVSGTTAVKYAVLARQLLYDPTDQEPRQAT